ncbi:MAG: hypothetical protein HY525_10590 [Betaproteobacteria bacterium]|nr:hypothetical protein [Betaproteobacteria bacterium]
MEQTGAGATKQGFLIHNPRDTEPTLLEKTTLDQLLANTDLKPEELEMPNQLNLFTEISGQ